MATVLYLAMKEEEFVPLMAPSVKTGWLDCCFSRSDPGLDCLPSSLPSGSLLILTDRLPFRDHDPVLIAQQLSQTVTALDCAAVLLDFEQPSVPELAKLAIILFLPYVILRPSSVVNLRRAEPSTRFWDLVSLV